MYSSEEEREMNATRPSDRSGVTTEEEREMNATRPSDRLCISQEVDT